GDLPERDLSAVGRADRRSATDAAIPYRSEGRTDPSTDRGPSRSPVEQYTQHQRRDRDPQPFGSDPPGHDQLNIPAGKYDTAPIERMGKTIVLMIPEEPDLGRSQSLAGRVALQKAIVHVPQDLVGGPIIHRPKRVYHAFGTF